MKIHILILCSVLVSSVCQAQSNFTAARTGLAQRQMMVPIEGFLTSKEQEKKITTKNGQYFIEKKSEDFGDGISDHRLNQIFYDKSTRKIISSSTTFDGTYLRTSTFCEGTLVDSGLTDKEVFCATASQKVCNKVLEVYEKQSGEKFEKNVKACEDTLKGYANILKAFNESMGRNAAIAGAREDILSTEGKETNNLLKRLDGGSLIKMNVINQLKTEDDINRAAQRLTSSIGGLQQISNFVKLCQDNKYNFNPKYADPNNPTGLDRRWPAAAPAKAQ